MIVWRPLLTRGRTDSLHQLSDILTIAILSVIAGGGWEDMEVYGLSKAWLSTFLALPNGIQVRIPFGEYGAVDAKQFAHFEQWIKQLVDLGIGVRLICKTVKGSYERETAIAALHLVSAWNRTASGGADQSAG